MIRTFLCSWLLLLAVVGSAGAQSLRGRLTTPSGQAIPGALFTLLDERGAPVRVTVSNRGGDFSFGSVPAGRFSLRVERIGRATVTGQPFTVGPTNTVTLALRQEESEPAGLAGIQVGRAGCSAGGPRGVAAPAWEHAARYLRIAALAEERGLLQVRGVRYTRRIDPDYGFSTGIVSQAPFADAAMPFPVPVAGQAFSRGFAGEDSAGAAVYRVASPEALLSVDFLENHCFTEVAQGAVPARVGLRFRPLPGRESVGLEGVMWLDRATAELHSVEYRYVDPRGLPGVVDGLVAFRNGPGALPQVSRWRLRTPLPVARGQRQPELLESGALALSPEGVPLDDPDGVLSVLAGVVSIDSLMVEAHRLENLPAASWRWTQGTLDLLGPAELVHAPQPDVFNALVALRPMWLTRRGSSIHCPPKDVLQLAARANCTMRQPAVYLGTMPVDGQDLEDKLTHIPLGMLSAVEYIRPIEAFMIFGPRENTSNGVILVHTRRP